MFLHNAPMAVSQIVIADREGSSTAIEYLAGLTSRGYVFSPQKELYLLTDVGKNVLGIQPITKDEAKSIMAYTPHDKAFNFYIAPDTPLHMHAHSLQDFANKLLRVDLKSLEFHICNDEFEAWFRCLGDQELTKKTALIKERKIVGEPLRLLLHTVVEQRCQELLKIAAPVT